MRSLLLTLCLWLLSSLTAWAAPAVIGTPVMGQSGASGTTSFTFSATCPSGNNNVLAVLCVGTKNSGATVVSFTGATWNSEAMTGTGAPAVMGGSNQPTADLYTLANPTCDGSSHTVAVTVDNASFSIAGIIFLKDVNLAAPYDTPVPATGATDNPSIVVPSATTDLVIDCIIARNSNTNLTVGGGHTGLITQTTNATASTNVEGGQTYAAGASPNVTMSYGNGATPNGWALIGASFNPAVDTRRRHAPRLMRMLPPSPFFFPTASLYWGGIDG